MTGFTLSTAKACYLTLHHATYRVIFWYTQYTKYKNKKNRVRVIKPDDTANASTSNFDYNNQLSHLTRLPMYEDILS